MKIISYTAISRLLQNLIRNRFLALRNFIRTRF